MRNTEPLVSCISRLRSDESGGFELTRVGGETQSSLRARRDEVDEPRGTGGAYDRSLPDWRPGGAGMEVSAHPRLITEVDGRPHGGSLSADGRISRMAPSSSHLVLIPAYNPGPRLIATVDEALRHWRPVLVVVDGSTDGSHAPVVERAGR